MAKTVAVHYRAYNFHDCDPCAPEIFLGNLLDS